MPHICLEYAICSLRATRKNSQPFNHEIDSMNRNTRNLVVQVAEQMPPIDFDKKQNIDRIRLTFISRKHDSLRWRDG